MPKELEIRALVESKMKAELIAIAEQEDVTYSPQGTKREIAVEILEAREAVEKAMAEATDIEDEMDAPEAELETDEIAGPVPIESLKEMMQEVADVGEQDNAGGFLLPQSKDLPAGTLRDDMEYLEKVVPAQEALKAASAAFLASGAKVDGPERKARREAKAKLYALTS